MFHYEVLINFAIFRLKCQYQVFAVKVKKIFYMMNDKFVFIICLNFLYFRVLFLKSIA